MYTSIPVNGMPADGYSTGDAIRAIEEVAAQTLPTGYGYEFGGITREEEQSSSNTTIIFIICVLFVYLILCALYESLFIPLAVILSVPFGLMGSFLFAKCFGLDNNIYMQTGLIMLIGLLSKTAILLTEYASTRRKQGMTIAQAAINPVTGGQYGLECGEIEGRGGSGFTDIGTVGLFAFRTARSGRLFK